MKKDWGSVVGIRRQGWRRGVDTGGLQILGMERSMVTLPSKIKYKVRLEGMGVGGT